MTVMLSHAEFEFREALEKYLGNDGASVMRQGMLQLGRECGLEFPLKTGDSVKGVGGRKPAKQG